MVCWAAHEGMQSLTGDHLGSCVQRTISALIHANANKNPLIRGKVASFVCAMIESMGPRLCGTRELERLFPLVVHYLSEGNAEPRSAGKRAIMELHRHNATSGDFDRLLRRCADADVRVVEKLLAQEHAFHNGAFAVTANSHLRGGALGSTLPRSTRFVGSFHAVTAVLRVQGYTAGSMHARVQNCDRLRAVFDRSCTGFAFLALCIWGVLQLGPIVRIDFSEPGACEARLVLRTPRGVPIPGVCLSFRRCDAVFGTFCFCLLRRENGLNFRALCVAGCSNVAVPASCCSRYRGTCGMRTGTCMLCIRGHMHFVARTHVRDTRDTCNTHTRNAGLPGTLITDEYV